MFFFPLVQYSSVSWKLFRNGATVSLGWMKIEPDFRTPGRGKGFGAAFAWDFADELSNGELM